MTLPNFAGKQKGTERRFFVLSNDRHGPKRTLKIQGRNVRYADKADIDGTFRAAIIGKDTRPYKCDNGLALNAAEFQREMASRRSNRT